MALKKADRLAAILDYLHREYAGAECALRHRSALELLVATILSAQCTDARVNLVTEELFVRYPAAKAYAEAPPGELEEAIRSTGFFNNKAKSLRGAAVRLVEHHGGEVPETMEELLVLPGVARKTANVVLGTWFGKPEGVVVDTHVKRLTGRLGLTRHETPERIEKDLMRLLPQAEWIFFSHALIHHGRRLCKARKPDCAACDLANICPGKSR